MGKKEMINLHINMPLIVEEIRKAITPKMADYFLANSDEVFGVYFDNGVFSVSVGSSVDCEQIDEEKPVASKKCPGIGNIHDFFFTDGWTKENEDGTFTTDEGKIFSFEECVSECCNTGDISDEIEELLDALIYDLTSNL